MLYCNSVTNFKMSSKQQFKVKHRFEAMAGSNEMTIDEDEILIVTNTDVGQGWWEGENSRGDRGIFPASYVEPFVSKPPVPAHTSQVAYPAPAIPSSQPSQSDSFLSNAQLSRFRDTTDPQVIVPPHQAAEEPDWPDEDWDDDDDDSGDNATEYGGSVSQRGYPPTTPYYGAVQPVQHGANKTMDLTGPTANLSIADPSRLSQTSGSVAGLGAGAGTSRSRKNFGQFSNFVKSGLESYLLEAKAATVPHENIVYIQYDADLGIVWKPNLNQYTCAVSKHGKESKMKGLKTYISYDITPSTSNIGVRRRYKHFDWLMQRMEQKYIVTPLPSLPEKQIAGRFQEDFVEHRRNLLQLWVNYITRHPVLSQCDVWWHFITCNSDDDTWKRGKRRAEKDTLVGANFFHSVDVNPLTTPLDPVKYTKQLENFQRFVSKFDEAVKHMFFTSVDQSKKFSTVYAKDYKKLSESIRELSSAFQSGTAWRNSLGLNEAIRQTSAAYEDISKLHEEEPKQDFEPMADTLHQYRGLLSNWPDILQVHKSISTARNEQERLYDEGKVSAADLARITQRANTVTYVTLAEVNHFHNERLVDFKQMMQNFLIAQINFHSEIATKLQSALNKINEA